MASLFYFKKLVKKLQKILAKIKSLWYNEITIKK